MELCVGIDWGNSKHQVEIQGCSGELIRRSQWGSSISELYELRDELLELADGPEAIKVGLEDPSRPIVRILLEADIPVFILTPRKVDSMRTVYSSGGAKDDELDAHIICEELRVHDNIFYELKPRAPIVDKLRRYYRGLEDAKEDIGRFAERLRSKLRDYYPGFLELNWQLSSRVMVDLLELMPTPQAARDQQLDEIADCLGRCRKHSAEEVRELLGQTSPLSEDERIQGVAETALYEARQLRDALQAEARWDQKLTELLEEISSRQKRGKIPSAADVQAQQPGENSGHCSEDGAESVSDVEIALSVDGIGTRTVAGLLSEGYHALIERDRELLRRQSIAPVTKQSGQKGSKRVHQRHARNQFLTETLHHVGDSLQRHNPHYRTKYEKMREQKNHTHGRACRQLSDQFLTVFFAMLRDRTLYDPNLHGATRR